ncbi:MAG: hypothetical protein KJZ78_05920 [Bryobacteraceae bacterium]|nr:hypothetical protein [Bryobacteraceae bacterium]
MRLMWMLLLGAASLSAQTRTIGNHQPRYDVHGILLPWTSWTDALDREMNWYLKCPIEHGYPRFVYMTFMTGDYTAIEKRRDFIPSTQNGAGIISYLKYYAWKGKQDPRLLRFARYMGDYLIKESLTPNAGKYPRFTRSTGLRDQFPQQPDCGSQLDKPYEIQPDKGGIAGYALVLLYEETRDQRYLDQALQNARVLAANMGTGGGTHSPWPFRVDYRTGEPRGPVSANMSYILRLFDKLIELDYAEFKGPREALWSWIAKFQIPNAARDGSLWVQFFEDYDKLDNKNAWSPLSRARYLIEKKEALDPEWKEHARTLIEFVNRDFTSLIDGVPVCGEQTYDKNPWGGVLSTYGAVLAMYSKATGSEQYKGLAYQALTYGLYAIDHDGCPRASALKSGRGSWQEDAYTDKVHNYVDAIAAYPEWTT